MEAEDVAAERQRAEEPDPLDDGICIILQGLSKRFPAEVRQQQQLLRRAWSLVVLPDAYSSIVRSTGATLRYALRSTLPISVTVGSGLSDAAPGRSLPCLELHVGCTRQVPDA